MLTKRVSHYCKLLASAYGLNEELQDIIFMHQLFMILGKIGIPDSIYLNLEN